MTTNYIIDGNFNAVPEARGIYSWFYPIYIYEEDTYDSFLHRVRHFLNFSLLTSDSREIIVFKEEDAWERFELSFRIDGKHNKIIQKNWNSIKIDKEFKRCVLESSFWNRPLYVGMAKNLSNRVDEHQNSITNFAKRFNQSCEKYNYLGNPDYRFHSSLSIKSLLLSYTVLDFKDSHIDSLEKILQQTTKPNFSKR
jgi:hypothetical protein